MKTEPRLILFDIDGTLIRTHGAGLRAIEKAVEISISKDLKDTRVIPHGRTDQQIISSYLSQVNIKTTKPLLDKIFKIYPEILKTELKNCNGEFLPGVYELLVRLYSASDVYLGIATGNIKNGAWIKLEHFKIAKYFVGGGFGDGYNDRVPLVCDAINSISEKLKIDFTKVAVCGDTPFDIISGQKNSCFTLGIGTGRYSVSELKKYHPDLAVKSLKNKNVLNSLLKF
ncbi:MAG: HAD family hydrolase [Candidatus Hydrogenedentota bacterium]